MTTIRIAIAAAALSIAAFAQSPTTVQDFVRSTGGGPLTGSLSVVQVPASDLPVTAHVYGGVFSVQLLPSAAGTHYVATFTSSNGVAAWSEAWSVPVSVAPVGLAQVRIGQPSSPALPGGSGITQLSGDVDAGPGSGAVAAVLPNVNAQPGPCGDPTHVCTITTNAKGLTTAAVPVAIAAASGGMTQLTGDVVAGPGTGSQAATLPVVNADTSQCGDATHACQVTANAKGLVVSAVPVAITGTNGAPAQCNAFSSQVLDFVPAYSSAAGGTLAINAGVSVSTPVVVRLPGTGTFYRATSAASVYVGSGAGTDVAYGYIDDAGHFDIGTSSAALVCTVCNAVTGVSSFPLDSVALFTWTISSGAFDPGGYTDFRSFIQ